MRLYGGIEAGGTKFVCAVGNAAGEIMAETQFPTTSPDETIHQAIEFFLDQPEPVKAVGIGAFGPVDPDPASPIYGYITTTPKPGWQHVDFASRVRNALKVPVGFDTDVNGAALGEHRWGAAQDIDTFVYLTIGTGIGGGGMVQGSLLHGLMHPEMGHLRIPHDWASDPFEGNCPFHRDCLEGLAAGPAVEARWGESGETLHPDHPAWPLEATYLAYALANIIFTLSPQRIIMGGGVMAVSGLIQRVRAKTLEVLGEYIQAPAIVEDIDQYIVSPGLGNRAGVLGAIALAQRPATIG